MDSGAATTRGAPGCSATPASPARWPPAPWCLATTSRTGRASDAASSHTPAGVGILLTSTSDVSRLAEPAGSQRTSSHYQMDLHYTQNIKLAKRYTVQVAADVFNIGNRQTGYNIQNQFGLGGFGSPRSFWDPRRGQLEVRFIY